MWGFVGGISDDAPKGKSWIAYSPSDNESDGMGTRERALNSQMKLCHEGGQNGRSPALKGGQLTS